MTLSIKATVAVRAVSGAGIAAIAFVLALQMPAGRPEREASMGTKEDPLARVRFEWVRQRDPATGTVPDDIRRKELVFASSLPSIEREAIQSLRKTGQTYQFVDWTARGPANVGGRTRALAVDILAPRVLIAGGVSGGMWRSNDAGISWSKTTIPGQIHSVTCCTQDIRFGRTNIWYYGTGELVGNSPSGGNAPYRGDGIFKSTDNGGSWTLLASTSTGSPENFDQPFDYVWNVVVSPVATEDVACAATIGGISRSADGGTTWTRVLGGLGNTDSRYTDIAVSPTGIFYATLSTATINGTGSSASAGVWRSADGITWSNILPATGWPASWKRLVVGIAPSDEKTVYIVGETPGSGFEAKNGDTSEWNSLWCYTYASGTGAGVGGTWEDRSANLPAFGGEVGDFITQGSYDLVLRVKPDDPNVVFLGGTNLYRSTNGFRTSAATTWVGGYAPVNNTTQVDNHHADQHSLVFSPTDPLILYSGHDGGISATSNCLAPTISWSSLNHGYNTTQFYSVALDHGTPGSPVVIGGTQDNGTWFTSSAAPMASWVGLLGGDGGYCAIANGRSSYYASFQNGETYRLLLNDATGGLQGYARVDPTGGTGYLFINPFILHPANTSMMFMAAGETLWRNSDLTTIPLGSQNTTNIGWTKLTGASVAGGSISALEMTKVQPADRLYYGTTNGQLFRLDGASTSSAGAAAADIGTGKGFPQNAYVSCIAADPADGNRALVVFSNYGVESLYYTQNAGQTWDAVSGNLEQQPGGAGNGPSARWAEILQVNGVKQYYVGTSTGLYSTQTLQGTSTVWALEGAAIIGNVVVDMMDKREQDGLIVAATHGQGVYSGRAMQGPDQPAGNQPTTLLQNYPNPFAASTRINFDLAAPAHVTIAVFDVRGRRVGVLMDEDRAAGIGQGLIWSPQSIASGVYICEMKAGSVKSSVKLLYLK